MAGYANFETKNKKHEHNRYDIYESEFETPFKHSELNANTITKHIKEFAELCSYLR